MLRQLISLAATALVLAGMVVSPARAQLADVPADHWSYDAVRVLANRGLVLGYPDGTFLGNRPVTRYEMATLIQRVLRHVEEVQAGTAATQGAPAPSPASGVTQEDLQIIRNLIEEYKVELTVIGTDLKAVQDEVAALREELTAVQQEMEPLYLQVVDPEGALPTVMSDVSRLKKVTVAGYVQARYTNEEGKDGDFGVRRARINARGTLGSHTRVTLQLDAAGDKIDNSVALRDAYVEYYVRGIKENYPTITFGQQKWPFGFQIVQSSGTRETPERAEFLRRFFPGERDRGIKISSPEASRVNWAVGVFNGVGINQTGTPWYSSSMADNNRHKDFVARLGYAVTDTLDIGMSGYWGKAGPNDALQSKRRWGADFQWFSTALPLSIKAEYAKAKEPTGPVDNPILRDPWGYYVQAAYSFSPKWTGVYMFDYFDDDGWRPTGKQKNHNIGLIHYLDDRSRVKLFHELRNDEKNPRGDVTTLEWITSY